jgi:hypothetical protein
VNVALNLRLKFEIEILFCFDYFFYLLAVDGTSCSSPVFAGVIAQLNDARVKAGKAVLGYSNALFYQAPAYVFQVSS